MTRDIWRTLISVANWEILVKSVCVGMNRKVFCFFFIAVCLSNLKQQEHEVRFSQGLHTSSVNVVEGTAALLLH